VVSRVKWQERRNSMNNVFYIIGVVVVVIVVLGYFGLR
jgi:predicted nucleic acid-binding Zn ribbon protein